MTDAMQDDESSPPSPRAVFHARARRGLGCLVWLVGFAVFVVVVYGIGRPNTYWYRIGTMQVFESEEGVVAFVEVDLMTHRPGLVRSPSVVSNPARLYRFDVRRDGAIWKLLLKSPAGQRHHLWIEQILKVPQGVFLVQTPSLGELSYRLHRIEEDRIKPLSTEESDPILRSLGYTNEGEGAADKITERNGWRLLERKSHPSRFSENSIVSERHRLRLRIDPDKVEQTLAAESFGEGDRWTAPILTVNTRRWRSYRSLPRE